MHTGFHEKGFVVIRFSECLCLFNRLPAMYFRNLFNAEEVCKLSKTLGEAEMFQKATFYVKDSSQAQFMQVKFAMLHFTIEHVQKEIFHYICRINGLSLALT